MPRVLACLLAVALAGATGCSAHEGAATPRPKPSASVPRPAATPARPTPARPKPVQPLRRLDLPALTVSLSGRAAHTVKHRKVWGSAFLDRYETNWSGVAVVRDTKPNGWDLPSALRTEADDVSGSLGRTEKATVDHRPALAGPITLAVDGAARTREVTALACGDLLVYVWFDHAPGAKGDRRLRSIPRTLRLHHDCAG